MNTGKAHLEIYRCYECLLVNENGETVYSDLVYANSKDAAAREFEDGLNELIKLPVEGESK